MAGATVLQTHQNFRDAKVFDNLDGLRAIAVLWVLLYHCPDTGVGWFDRWMGAGDLGVDLFFAISGFLITTLILREAPAPLGQRLKKFYMRRALRIFPLFYLAVVVYWAAAVFISPHRLERFLDFLPSLLLYFNDIKLAHDPSPIPVFGHAWSLAVEEKYYLVWPLLVMAWPARRMLFLSLGLIVAAILIRLFIAQTYTGDVEARLYYSFDTRFDSILWGAVAAFVLATARGYQFLQRAGTPWVLVLAVLALCVYGSYAGNDSHLRYVLIPWISVTILVCYLCRPRMLGTRLLEARPMVYVGRISYGIYVFHPLAISVAVRVVGDRVGVLSPWMVMALSVALSILVAGLSYRYFETWFLRLKSRFKANYTAPAPASKQA